MRKFILCLVIMFMTVFSANAQIATENSNGLDNVYVGVTGGVSTPLDFNSVFPVNPAVGVKIGKEFTPVFGFEVEGLAVLNDNHFTDLKTTVKATNLNVSGVFNLSNVFFGYQGTPRVFEVKTNTGIGWLYYWKTNKSALSSKTGVDFVFNIGKQRAHSIVVTPAIYWNLNKLTNLEFNKHNAQFSLMASYIYHFKTSNGTHHFKTYDIGAMTDEINRLNDELAKKPKEVIVEKVVTAPAKVEEHATGFGVNETIYFAFDSAELDDRAKETLDKLGQNGIYAIDAYASSEGSTEYNKELSQRRADAVKAYLEGRGARIESAVGHGVQFGTTTGRVAIVRLK